MVLNLTVFSVTDMHAASLILERGKLFSIKCHFSDEVPEKYATN
jgi:hypothetical protein